MPDQRPAASDAPTVTSAPKDLRARSVISEIALDPSLEVRRTAAVARGGRRPRRYEVRKLIGQGGMGEVYVVYDRDLRREVALKIIRARVDSDAQRRFLEEAQVMGQLQHPNILPVYDVGLTGGKKLYYTMPLVRGRSLRSLIDELRTGDERASRTYSLTRLVQVFVQVAHAVAYAHAKRVLHRDLKPANIMLGEHGEVQVIDWGISKVIAGAEIETDLAGTLTWSGRIVGTPAYMSPEQARGAPVDERTDIYALGTILYELLTFEVPFEGPGTDVLAALGRDLPLPPHEAASGRTIPAELERICMRALSKEPEDRQGSVDAFHAEVQAWLEAKTDREQRHERAEARASEGRAKLEEYRQLRSEVELRTGEAEEVAKRFDPWQPIEEKAERIAAEDRAREARQRLVEAEADAVGMLEMALGFEPDNGTARGLIADYYWDRLLEAEKARSESEVAFFRRRVAAYHDGKYARALKGDGSLQLTSDPPGAEIWLHELVEEGFLVVERNPRRLGVTPLEPTPLAMGSYLVVLHREGYRDTRYPVYVTRNRSWTGQVRLLCDAEIGAGFIHIPAGPFLLGGDAEAYNGLPGSTRFVPDFLIGEHPVTMGEYLEFLNEVARMEGLEAAKRRGCRPEAQAPTYLVEDGAGGLRLPDVDAEGDSWVPRLPAVGISWHDAVAYCAWRSARDGMEVRLASEEEWEKAARGVDGRWFPWGWRFDPSLCNMGESRKERNAPVAVDEYPRDRSVYGVRGLGGNVRDWTVTEIVQGLGPTQRVSRVLRGGLWGGSSRYSRAAYRHWGGPTYVGAGVGFRLARSLPVSTQAAAPGTCLHRRSGGAADRRA